MKKATIYSSIVISILGAILYASPLLADNGNINKIPSSSGGGTPALPFLGIQYNNNGVFGATSTLTYSTLTKTLGLHSNSLQMNDAVGSVVPSVNWVDAGGGFPATFNGSDWIFGNARINMLPDDNAIVLQPNEQGVVGIGIPESTLANGELQVHHLDEFFDHDSEATIGQYSDPIDGDANNGSTALHTHLQYLGGSKGEVYLSSYNDSLEKVYGVASVDSDALNFFEGKVGIGTNNPSHIFEVNGINPDVSFYDTAASSRLSFHIAGGVLDELYNGAPFFETDGSNNSYTSPNDFQFYTPTASGNNLKFVIKQTGNVGIGSTSPSTKLVVVGTTTVQNLISTSTTATNSFANAVTISKQNSTQLTLNDSKPLLANDIARLDFSHDYIGTMGRIESKVTDDGLGSETSLLSLSNMELGSLKLDLTLGSASSTFSGKVNTTLLNVTSAATSSFADGINLASGCYAIAGTCVVGGGGVSGGTAGMLASWTNATTLTATSAPTFASFTATSSAAVSTMYGSLKFGSTTNSTKSMAINYGYSGNTAEYGLVMTNGSGQEVGAVSDSGVAFYGGAEAFIGIKDRNSSTNYGFFADNGAFNVWNGSSDIFSIASNGKTLIGSQTGYASYNGSGLLGGLNIKNDASVANILVAESGDGIGHFTVLNNGNVGIGTLNPTHPFEYSTPTLHNGTGNIEDAGNGLIICDDICGFVSTDNIQVGALIYIPGEGTYAHVIRVIDNNNMYVDSGTGAGFEPFQFSTNNVLDVIDTAGYLGVGTSTPDSNLDVKGSVRFEGASTAESSSISGAITGIGCDYATISGLSGLSSTTVPTPAFESYPGAAFYPQAQVMTSSTIRVGLCSDVTATPTATKIVVKIIK